MAGWNIEDRKYYTTYAYRRGLLTDKPNFSLMDGDYYLLGDDGSYEWGFVGIFARVNYNYKDRYLFELSGRYDGSYRRSPSWRAPRAGSTTSNCALRWACWATAAWRPTPTCSR